MIHTLITAISTSLPMPHILSGVTTSLLIAAGLFLWLKRGNRSGAIMLLALAIGLGVLTWGVLEGQKPAPFDWGSLESLGQTLVGPFEYRSREQIMGGILVAAALFFYVVWSRTGGEVAVGAQVAQKLQKGQNILGNARLVDPLVFKKRWTKPDPLGLTPSEAGSGAGEGNSWERNSAWTGRTWRVAWPPSAPRAAARRRR